MKSNKLSYRERIAQSSKISIDELLVKLSEPLDSELEDRQLKSVISGRLEIIKAIRELIIRLAADNSQSEWIKTKLIDFKEGVENTFDVLEDMANKSIDESDQTKYASIAKSRNEATKFMEDIQITIEELEQKIEKGETELSATTFNSSIENLAVE